jgi:diguanylate cyclase (GGDEF)-like protein
MSSHVGNKKASLTQLLAVMLSLALICLLVGNLALNIVSTRGYLQKQLYVHAQDSATSLGLSLSTVIDADDDVLAGRMIDAIFDSGEYSKILYFGVDKRLRVEKRLIGGGEQVPSWFRSLVDIESPLATSQVMSGWKQLGELVVQTSASAAHKKLWEEAQNQLIWFGLVLFSALLGMRLMLIRLLGPLREVERQAREMSKRNFAFRLDEPRTRELANVSKAMNEMAGTLGRLFQQQLDAIESLRSQSLLDSLTGLHNREGFDRRLRAELESRQSVKQGTLIVLKVADFDAINQSLGRTQGDEILKVIAGVIGQEGVSRVDGFAARRSGADFSLFLPDLVGDEVESVVADLMARLSSLSWVKQILKDDILHLGLAAVRPLDDVGRLLSKADMALRSAQERGISGWMRYMDSADGDLIDDVKEANHWHSILREAISNESILLYRQGVYLPGGNEVLFQQALARVDVDGVVVEAGHFIPMARRFNLMVELDKLVIGKTLSLVRESRQLLGISVSEASIADADFLNWLDDELSQQPELCPLIYVQLPEFALCHNEKGAVGLCEMLNRLRVKVVVERFGISSVPFSYLQRLNIDAIKVDHSFVRDIHENIENQFFLRSVIQLAGSQGVSVIAVGVESEQELSVLRELGVSAVMGYLLGRPEPLI